MLNRSWYMCPVIKPPEGHPKQKSVFLPSPPIVMVGEIVGEPMGFLHIKLTSLENDVGEVQELEELTVEVMPEAIQIL